MNPYIYEKEVKPVKLTWLHILFALLIGMAIGMYLGMISNTPEPLTPIPTISESPTVIPLPTFGSDEDEEESDEDEENDDD